MKISDINIDIVCQYLNIFMDPADQTPEGQLFKLEIESYMAAAKAYIIQYSDLTPEELENNEYLAIPLLTLISDMYENKSLEGAKNSNPTFKSLMWLGKNITV